MPAQQSTVVSAKVPGQRGTRREFRLPDPSPRLRAGAASATVWYLRLIAVFNIIAVLSLPFRKEVEEHNDGQLFTARHVHAHTHHAGQFFTPYLATAGLVSAA